MGYKRAGKYPPAWFDLLAAVAQGATTDAECPSESTAVSERKRWYSFFALLRKEGHAAAADADRVIIRTEGSRIIWEPRLGGRSADIAASALRKLGRSTPTQPSAALRALLSEAQAAQAAKAAPHEDKLASYGVKKGTDDDAKD